MKGQQASVIHFTEAFLKASEDALREYDLRSIIDQLMIDRTSGSLVQGVPNLRRLEFNPVESDSKYDVWYFDFPDTPHLEVVGFSKSETSRTSVLSPATLWRLAKVAMFLRGTYRAVSWCKEHLQHVI